MKRTFTHVLPLIVGFFTASLAFGQAIEVSETQIDFGTHAEETNTAVSLELTNLLSEDIAIESITFFEKYGSNPFSAENVPATIPGNGSVSIDVVFSPLHNIDHNSEMVINTGGNRGSVSVDLRGDCEYTNTYYNDTHDLIDEDLKEALHDILGDGYDDHSYSGARDEMFMVIDNQAVNGQGASQNTLTRAYLGTDAVGYTSRSNAQSNFNLNTEHIFPQGFFNQDLPMRSDLHHLVVTDVNANGTRANYAFGTVVNATWEQGGSKLGTDANGTTVFEPRDLQKGMNARAVLYFVLRYENYAGFVTANQEIELRNWNDAYPPTTVEDTRNDDIHEYQNNRNPITDYPQFADRIYSFRLPEDRPNVGEFHISHDEIDFVELENGVSTTFNVVVNNNGERFFTISNLEITENGSGVYSIDESVPTSMTVQPGQSVNIPVVALANSGSADLTAMLNFSTNLSSVGDVSLPIEASTVTSVSKVVVEEANVYAPNPFDAYLTMIGDVNQVESVRIYDITGRQCVHLTNNFQRLDVSNLATGVYQAIVLEKDGTILTQKLIKQ